jgi:uncharacterized protein (DUF2384 family)
MIPFRKRRTGPVLSREEGVRQGAVVRSAQAALRSTEAVRAFLNSHHAGLSGRPIDLAVASQAGLLAVQGAIAAQALHLGLGDAVAEAGRRQSAGPRS